MWDACHHSSFMSCDWLVQSSPTNVHKGGLSMIISIYRGYWEISCQELNQYYIIKSFMAVTPNRIYIPICTLTLIFIDAFWPIL